MGGETLLNREKSQQKHKLGDDEGAQLVGSNLKAYPSSITKTTIEVSSGTGTHTTTTELVGVMSYIGIKAPSYTVGDTFKVTISDNSTSMPLIYDQTATRQYFTYKTETPVQGKIKIDITSAANDGDYEMWIQYKSGASATYG